MMLVEMFSKVFFRNHIYWDVFENLTFRKFPAIRYNKRLMCASKTNFPLSIITIKTYVYVTVLAKTRLVRTKTEFNFIAAVYRHTQYLSITSVSSVKC